MVSVLISGAGPVGLTMANELARYDIPVRIVDKEAQRTDKSKALVLWSRTLELLDHGGYAEPFIKAGMQGHGAQISDGTNVVARARNQPSELPGAVHVRTRVAEENTSHRPSRKPLTLRLTALGRKPRD